MRRERVAVFVVVVAAAAIALVLLYLRGPKGAGLFPECLLHRWTGWNCPTCGMTRATHAALHGRLWEAFRFNPLGVLLTPVVLVFVAARMPTWLRGEPSPFRFNPGLRGALGLLMLVIVYGILRNIPLWPLTLLAPP